VAPLETIGLFGFAWTSLGPDHGIPWIAPMIFSCLVGIANVSQTLYTCIAPAKELLPSIVRYLPILN
jgi:hypothetical protein